MTFVHAHKNEVSQGLLVMRMRRFELKFSRERGGSQGRREGDFAFQGDA